MSILIHR